MVNYSVEVIKVEVLAGKRINTLELEVDKLVTEFNSRAQFAAERGWKSFYMCVWD